MNSNLMLPWRTRCRGRLPYSRRSGFTLVEVMVALFILVGGMISATMFFASMARAARFTDDAITATGMAQARIESLLEQPYGSMTSGYDTTNHFARSWSVQYTNTLATIHVTVGWTDTTTNRNSITLGTIRAP